MAFSKEQKEEIVKQYTDWLDKSKAVFVLSYSKMRMPSVNDARARLRESDAEMHVVKNRLFKLVLDEKGLPYDESFWEGNNVVTFAFNDPPSVAKVLTEITKGNDVFAIRAGYLDMKPIAKEQIVALAELPTLPVMRATLLGTILAPASKLVRTLAEPARGLAAVIKANYEKQANPA